MLIALLLAHAAPGQTSCPAHVALPAKLSGWNDPSSAPTIGKAFIVPGQAPATVRGLTAADIARGGQAALVPIQIDSGGTYKIVLSDGAWIDLMAGAKTLSSTGHSHGAACSGIHTIVDFKLSSGRYALHLTGMNTANVRVLIVRA